VGHALASSISSAMFWQNAAAIGVGDASSLMLVGQLGLLMAAWSRCRAGADGALFGAF
jgi:hypothetical protein